MKRPAARSIAALLGALVLALVALLAPRGALAKFEPPPLRGHVVDAAGALDDAAEQALAARLGALREQKGFAIVVYFPTSLEGLTIEDVAYDTFNTWGVGAQGKDDGVLLVVAMAEKKLRIETGKGVGDRLTDVRSSRIIREIMSPRMAAGDVPGAVDEGTKAIERALTGEDPMAGVPPRQVEPRRRAEPSKPMSTQQMLILGAVFVVVIFLCIVSRTFRGIVFAILRALVWIAFLRGGRGSFGGGGGGGGFGGGGGGYGGGGGRSGGGGASGGW